MLGSPLPVMLFQGVQSLIKPPPGEKTPLLPHQCLCRVICTPRFAGGAAGKGGESQECTQSRNPGSQCVLNVSRSIPEASNPFPALLPAWIASPAVGRALHGWGMLLLLLPVADGKFLSFDVICLVSAFSAPQNFACIKQKKPKPKKSISNPPFLLWGGLGCVPVYASPGKQEYCAELETSLGRVGGSGSSWSEGCVCGMAGVFVRGSVSPLGYPLCVSVVLQTSFYFVRNETFNLGDGAGITHGMCNPNPFFYYSGAKGQQQVLH